jgi:hypothetical protein
MRQKRPLGRKTLNGFRIWKVLRAFGQLCDVQYGRGSVCLGLSAIPHRMLEGYPIDWETPIGSRLLAVLRFIKQD